MKRSKAPRPERLLVQSYRSGSPVKTLAACRACKVRRVMKRGPYIHQWCQDCGDAWDRWLTSSERQLVLPAGPVERRAKPVQLALFGEGVGGLAPAGSHGASASKRESDHVETNTDEAGGFGGDCRDGGRGRAGGAAEGPARAEAQGPEGRDPLTWEGFAQVRTRVLRQLESTAAAREIDAAAVEPGAATTDQSTRQRYSAGAR